ncbi:Mss4-like protein [Russula earlei]|uniref:Mss4-like protein n=1 Tax=Russula earlei TaxID=71964 RepID=A0ACC0U076_9AGAM|nr:Mss4-like protein [Russula earlei]
MPVELKGSCHCGSVAFTVQSSTPVPYMLCICSICRKVGGAGGSVNLGAHAETLRITKGRENISIYNAVLDRGTPRESRAKSERHFCSKCSAMLWLWDETWPELLHPYASAIDEPELKAPEEMTVAMKNSAPCGKKIVFKEYPDLSLEEWHKANNEYVE